MDDNRPLEPADHDLDSDPVETEEWGDALASVARVSGGERVQFLLNRMQEQARQLGVASNALPFSSYRNTIPADQQDDYPGDLAMEERVTSIIRWNALAMVVRANAAYGDLGGHIASYASAAEIFEVGFNHFFRGSGEAGAGGDLVYFQPHSAGRLRAGLP